MLTIYATDHCAESLRQKIMCQPNMGIITYNWIKGKKIPMANFNVQHKCRDFEGILDWALEEQAKAPEGGSVMRPEIEEVVEFVEPPFNIYADE